jgi:prefoldin subunit 5
MADAQKSMQKIALVLEKLARKVDEVDTRLRRLEERVEGGGQKEAAAAQKSAQVTKSDTANAAMGSFLGSMAGTMAGLGLFHLIFDDRIEPAAVAGALGVENALGDLEAKVEDLGEKIDTLDQDLDELLAQVEPFDDGVGDAEFERMSLDDYLAREGGEGFDEGFDADFGDFDA